MRSLRRDFVIGDCPWAGRHRHPKEQKAAAPWIQTRFIYLLGYSVAVIDVHPKFSL